MSGIAGIIHFDGKPVEFGQIEAMTAAMYYRGPDGINHWFKGNVALGQCMLRTTPESLEETQPLTNEDESLVLVMDGRVDNWEELRRELLGKGAVLRTRADAELVLRAYEVWGRDCLPHIDGDFALVIWDARLQEAFCARDRIGNKPFHYHWNGKTMAFASELHPILELPWVGKHPNKGMLSEFLAWEIHSLDETLWEGVMRLAPAYQMMVANSGVRLILYWEPDLQATLPLTRDEEYFEHYRELLIDSVRRLSRSYRPLAYEVSGGLDSSALFCVADHLHRAGNLRAPGLEGYTLVFDEESEANELTYARAVGSYLGVTIHEIPASMMPQNWYRECAREWRDFPGFPNGAISQPLFTRAAGGGSRVVINGIGGDEWLSGSRIYYAEELSRPDMNALYECFRADISAYNLRHAVEWLLRYGFFLQLPPSWQSAAKAIFHRMRGHRRLEAGWLSPQAYALLLDRRRKAQGQQVEPIGTYGQQQLIETLHNAFRVLGGEITERMAARSGLEIRRPFHTIDLVQFAFVTPERLRLHQKIDKYIHVKSLQGLLPQKVLERRSKADFSHLFRAPLNDMQHLLTETIPQRRSTWVSEDGMKDLYRTYQESPHSGWPLWVLWMVYSCHNADSVK